MRARQLIDKVVKLPVKTVLDIGSGDGEHAEYMRGYGLEVTTLDLKDADIIGDFQSVYAPKVDLIWCSHVLEHQKNVNQFLVKCYQHCDWLAVTVPPFKPEIVGGHLTLWNAGLLIYNLILAGFDCRDAQIKTEGYDVMVLVEKKPFTMPKLKHDFGDIEALSHFFPFPVVNGFNGNIESCNW